MSSCQIIHADVLDWCAEYDGPKFHAILCDPSYAMSKKKRLDMNAPVDTEIEMVGDVVAAYHSLQQWGDTGFMGRHWDDSVAFNPETWRALARHLHPGGFIMAFASSRGDHRLAVAMEDAGLVIHPKIFIWLNGQSFPKATRPFKSPKKWREVQHRWLGWMGKLGNWILRKRDSPPKYYLDFIFGSYRYGRQALKNCAEPIIVAQKPYSGKPVDSIVETGAGALWIDGGRVATGGNVANTSPSHQVSAGWDRPWRHRLEASQRIYEAKLEGNRKAKQLGRWPPNFALCHVPSHKICQSCQAIHPIQPMIEVCPDCGGELEFVEGCSQVGVKRVKGAGWRDNDNIRPGFTNPYHGPNPSSRPEGGHYADSNGLETVDTWQCSPECPARKLGEMSGERPISFRPNRKAKSGYGFGPDGYGKGGKVTSTYPDKGTAARFYPQAGWEHEEIECLPECPVRKLDEQAGEREVSGTAKLNKVNKAGAAIFGSCEKGHESIMPNDSGGASRFYPNADWQHEVAEQLAEADPVRYVPKAAKKERNNGLDDFYWRRDKKSPTGFVRVSQEEWEALDKRQRARGNIHSTVKPISLLVWLAMLLLPPPEYAPRRIVIPFSGSGSETIGAFQAGWEEIVAVELYRDYCDINEARVAFWSVRQPALL